MNKNGERGVGGGGGCPVILVEAREMRKFFSKVSMIKIKLQQSVCVCLHVHANDATSYLQ